MSMTGLSVFDTTVQKTNVWVNDLASELKWDDKKNVFQAMRATLHALRDRMPAEEAVHLGAQLPILLKGFYYEDWSSPNQPSTEKSKDEFLAHIQTELQKSMSEFNAEEVARAVFRLLAMRVSTGEIEDVTTMMPKEVEALWPQSMQV
jgi:uncharacterized protein (DUF2267 family)